MAKHNPQSAKKTRKAHAFRELFVLLMSSERHRFMTLHATPIIIISHPRLLPRVGWQGGTHRGDVVNEDGPDEVALPLVRLQQLGALGLSILDQPLDEVRAALADYRGDGRVVLRDTSNTPPVN
jgi:hypothetical protein